MGAKGSKLRPRNSAPEIARDPYKVSIGAFLEKQIAAAALITYRPYDDVFDITYISTAAHAQNQGIAQQLIQQCVITAQEHPKFKDLTSDIMTCAIDRRNTKSQRAFERFGFTLVDDSHPQLLEYALRFMRGLLE
ncbi:GNAT family N-acetyltransferase [Rothia nasimurium]|uniref:GNAT family N-acetyltransferase n=1 Tax=Rothia nasimurium TaxID=85336 RepID=UPI00301490EB